MKWKIFSKNKKKPFFKGKISIRDKIFGLTKQTAKKNQSVTNKVRKIYAPNNTLLNEQNIKNTKKITYKLSTQLFLSSLYFKIINFPVLRFFFNSGRFFGIVFSVFFVYLCFIDTTFVVKNITIEFEKDSFLDKKTIEKLDSTIKNYRYFGSVTFNQLARELFSEIQDVTITKTTWPNTVSLKVKTKPILATLSVNNNSNYVVISQNGTVLGRDNYNLRSNVVTINSITNQFEDSSKIITLEPTQLEKLYFLEYITDVVSSLKQPVSKQIISSLSEFDNTTITKLSNGTQLFFDTTLIDKDYLTRRVQTMLTKPEVINDMVKNEVSYIDFRSPGKVFLCKINEKCALDNSIK
jgi:cell division septal protein FtsQ